MNNDRATIFVMDVGKEPSEEFRWVVEWLTKWDGKVAISGYSTGGWEHLWDVEGPKEAISEIPEELLCHSDWVEQIESGWKIKSSPKKLKFKLSSKRQ